MIFSSPGNLDENPIAHPVHFWAIVGSLAQATFSDIYLCGGRKSSAIYVHLPHSFSNARYIEYKSPKQKQLKPSVQLLSCNTYSIQFVFDSPILDWNVVRDSYILFSSFYFNVNVNVNGDPNDFGTAGLYFATSNQQAKERISTPLFPSQRVSLLLS